MTIEEIIKEIDDKILQMKIFHTSYNSEFEAGHEDGYYSCLIDIRKMLEEN